ncbi:hypothetical protein, partial [Angustibacter sp. Root456]|uniref:hypothetical protein n=1 Tax=Angustibacter sp. Root456 TaxID=1736539 RepID=UPI0006FA81E7
DLTNAGLLCGFHHRYAHATGATGQLINGTVVWDTRPPGSNPPDPRTSDLALPPHRRDHLIARLVRQWVTPGRE